VISVFFLVVFFFRLSHSGHAPMAISDPSMISKWENLQNNSVFKYLFSSLYMPLIHYKINIQQSHTYCISFLLCINKIKTTCTVILRIVQSVV